MSAHQLPLSIVAAEKRETRTQFAALPFRVVDGSVQVLLVTSRRSRRWILPKGWPEPGLTPAQCAAKEAWEEAGVLGAAYELCLGVYAFEKERDGGPDLPVLAFVYPIKVQQTKQTYPEACSRRRKWVPLRKAAKMVDAQALARILKTFDPRVLKGHTV
ncbi:MAG: NUDIX hydrolase [Pseudomonadota bacterium]